MPVVETGIPIIEVEQWMTMTTQKTQTTRMDTDTRSKVYGGEGGGGGLVNRVAKGTSDYRDEDILDNEGKPTGASASRSRR